MKKRSIFLCCAAAALMLNSCSQMYKFVQVVQTQPVSEEQLIVAVDGGLLYEDEVCAIFYATWSDDSNTPFAIYNKSNQILNVVLTKSFFIRNGVAYDYYGRRTYTTSTSTTLQAAASVTASNTYAVAATATAGAYNFGSMRAAAVMGTVTSAAGTTSTKAVAQEEARIVSIPPHTSRQIMSFVIADGELLDCDLQRYPETSSTITYTADDSPLRFSNYLTYTLGGSEQEQQIVNDFYVAAITNYAAPEIIVYEERDRTCNNVLSPDEQLVQKNSKKLYDAYVNVPSAGRYFIPYKTLSQKRIYKFTPAIYVWDYGYKAYIRTTDSVNVPGSTPVKK